MLKTYSKQARLNIQAYIKDHFDGCSYGIETPDTFKELSEIILDTFNSEKPACGSYSRMTEQERFEEWAAGLPSILDTCCYYNRSAVDDLGAILEETDSEKARYSEQQAETRLTYFIYRELVRGCR